MKFYYGVNPKEKREKLITSKVVKPYIDEIIDVADDAINKESPALKLSEYLMFCQNGNRTVFEKGYFDRRRKCSSLMIAYWLTQDDKYLIPLADYIFYICDEFTWCLPAHYDLLKGSVKGAIECIDLFQSETARLFSEIVMCVGDKLPEYVLERMKYEIDRRIFATIKPGNDEKYWWEKCHMNWAVVCSTGCMMAALYFAEENEKDYYVNRFRECMDSYLVGTEEDGCCLEGMSYWGYGYGHFVMSAQIVKEYTDGEIDYFKIPKVKNAALFPQKARMSESKIVSISDGGEAFFFSVGLISCLKDKYDEVRLPDIKYGKIGGNVNSVFQLLWFDENYEGEPLPQETNYFADSEWYINRCEKFCLAAKGGHNDEPHNHNDIGSFMMTVGDETFISDVGRGEYVKDTFVPDKRYTFVQNSSRGHSVPVINGEYQHDGREFSAKNAKADANSFELDIEGAYTKGAINKINRRFDVLEDRVVLVDTFEHSLDTTSVVERFISKINPKLCDGYVDFGIGRIVYDKEKFKVQINTETFVDMNGKDIVTVYMTDFGAVSEDERILKFEFVV